MNISMLLITILATATLSIFPAKVYCTTSIEEPRALPSVSKSASPSSVADNKNDEETPIALPLTAAQPNKKAQTAGEIWEEDDHEVLIRNERGTKENGNGNNGKKGKNKKNKNSSSTELHNKSHKNTPKEKVKSEDVKPSDSSCRYVKSPWSECDVKSNTRSRTLTLKKGDDTCDKTRTIQKKCKKACRYEKGTWSECASGQMSRTDKLKSSAEQTCQSTRVVNKNCNSGKSKGEKKDRKNKDKGNRKSRS